MPAWLRRKPRIRSLLLLANLLLLALPLGGLWLLRLYESALVRQTESELVAQAAVIGAAYHAAWRAAETGPPTGMAPLGASGWAPRLPRLDLARDPVLPVPPPATVPPQPPIPRALAAAQGLQPVLQEAQRITLAGMRVLDAQGIVVASSREEQGLSLLGQEEVAAALAGREAAVLRRRISTSPPAAVDSISRSAGLRVFVAQPVLEDGAVIGAVLLSRTPASLGQVLWGKRAEVAALVLAVLAGAALLALFIGYAVARPIQAVAAQARAVAGGARRPPQRLRASAVREADELREAIQAMAATLERRAEYIGGFAVEVSHEFKTPLAALRGGLELLQDHGATMTPAERDRFLAQAMADVQRLDRLVRQLLELARAEAPPPAAEARCEVGAVVQVAATTARQAGLPVALEAPAAPLWVRIGAEPLRAVLVLLLDNARQHAGPQAQARITWGPAAGGAVLRVSDSGPGISPGHAGRIFERFFTTARARGGSGLGLPIARARLEAAGGSIRLLPGQGGACFEIQLPGADGSLPAGRRPRTAQ
nr:HAMP domain-containing sensor histidine kinase [Roseomonas sp. GC11]